MNISVSIITKSKELPDISYNNFLHSRELFSIIEQLANEKPYMFLAMNSKGRIVGHILTILRMRHSYLPPFATYQARIYGEGEYDDDVMKEEVFAHLLIAITKYFNYRNCLYIEFSDLSIKMFGYKCFRENGFFPIRWMNIKNSLHSRPPKERLNKKSINRIVYAYKHGVRTEPVEDFRQLSDLYCMFKKNYKFKPLRFLPVKKFFELINKSKNCTMLVSRYKGKAIGGATIVYSKENAFLWYYAAKSKTYPLLHPGLTTIWNAISLCHKRNYKHIIFMNTGLPFKRSRFRDFILTFGGKPYSSYRWFKINIPYLSRLSSWLFRE